MVSAVMIVFVTWTNVGNNQITSHEVTQQTWEQFSVMADLGHI